MGGCITSLINPFFSSNWRMSLVRTTPRKFLVLSTTIKLSTLLGRIFSTARTSGKLGGQLIGSVIMISRTLMKFGDSQIRCLPTKLLTYSLQGAFRIVSGRSYCKISPLYMIQILSATLTASPMSWVTKTMVFFNSSWRVTSSSWSWDLVRGSRALKGSSIKMILGSVANARATPIRCFWPPDSSLG